MQIRLVYTEWNVCKMKKESRAATLTCSTFQLSAKRCRNNFHKFLSLNVNCKNKLLKVY